MNSVARPFLRYALVDPATHLITQLNPDRRERRTIMTRSLSTRNAFRPSLEQLEDRRLMTTFNLLPTLTSAQRALITSPDAWTAAPVVDSVNSTKQENQVLIDALKPDNSTIDY